MGLLEEAAQVLRNELNSLSGFAVPITLTTPEGTQIPLKGFATDIAISLDPDTGAPVRGRKASVSLSIKDLEEAGISLPENIPEDDRRPWLVTWTPLTGGTQTMKVSDTLPDKLGIVVLFLETHRTSAWTGSSI